MGDLIKINEPLATDMLHHAIDEGVNYVDTAYPYHGISANEGGMSEILVGNALRDDTGMMFTYQQNYPAGMSKRKKILITTLMNSSNDFKLTISIFICYTVLDRDIWKTLTDLDVFEFLDSALEDGRIGYAGFSFHDEYRLFQ